MNNSNLPTNGQIIASGGTKMIQLGKTIGSGGNATLIKNEVDILFVIDTTGSMDYLIDALLNSCKQLVDEAQKLKLNPRFALISFGDIRVLGGGDSIDLVTPFTGNIELIKNGLTHIPHNNGFGNDGESCLEALEKALTIKCRPTSVKVVILITDDSAHQHHISASKMIDDLVKKEYLTYVIATDEEYYKQMARKTGGVWKDVTKTTSLNEVLNMFRELVKKVVQVVKDVHLVANGSVSKYLQLNPPIKK